jgi:TetR/AcrR family transcriptional regulator, mexJK operon transcriptional repressor
MAEKLAHRPVDQAKQRAILESARTEFFKHGYAAASIERIAVSAGVSKVTIYNHYKTKGNLFSAIVGEECRTMRGQVTDIAGPDTDIRAELLRLAQSMMAFLSNPDIIRFDRRMAAEIEHQPEMGELFLEAGPRSLQTMLTSMMASAMGRGTLDKADPAQAAAHFYGIIKGFADVEWRFSEAKIAAGSVKPAALNAAVDRFLRAYQPRI